MHDLMRAKRIAIELGWKLEDTCYKATHEEYSYLLKHCMINTGRTSGTHWAEVFGIRVIHEANWEEYLRANQK